MLLLLPEGALIQIAETTYGGRLLVRDSHGLDREVRLNVRELRTLAAMARQIARRVAIRPEGKP